MRTKRLTMLAGLLALALLLPSPGWAKRVTVGGSMTFTKNGDALGSELVVTTVISNHGLEKAITLQAPLPGPIYALPFFVNKDLEHEDEGDLDTILVLTNATGSELAVTIKLWDGAGVQIGSAIALTLNAHESRGIFLSTLLP